MRWIHWHLWRQDSSVQTISWKAARLAWQGITRMVDMLVPQLAAALIVLCTSSSTAEASVQHMLLDAAGHVARGEGAYK
jgi:hypothetical protein